MVSQRLCLVLKPRDCATCISCDMHGASAVFWGSGPTSAHCRDAFSSQCLQFTALNFLCGIGCGLRSSSTDAFGGKNNSTYDPANVWRKLKECFLFCDRINYAAFVKISAVLTWHEPQVLYWTPQRRSWLQCPSSRLCHAWKYTV